MFFIMAVLWYTSDNWCELYYNHGGIESRPEDLSLLAEQSGQTQYQDISDATVKTPFPPQIPVKGYYLYINLDLYTMYVYKAGELLNTYPVSGGKTLTPSPAGTWKITGKDTWGEGFGGAWLALNVPYGKYGIHGTIYPWTIGKGNSSKGCIRMLNKDVLELYKKVPIGSTVTIVQDNRPFRTMKNGDIGSDVAELQKALKNLGYYTGSADGKYGDILKSSVKKFQKDNALYASGEVSKQTYYLICQKAAEKEALPK